MLGCSHQHLLTVVRPDNALPYPGGNAGWGEYENKTINETRVYPQLQNMAPLFIMSLFSSVIFNLLLPNLNGEYFDELTRGAEHRLYTVLFYLLIVNAGGLVLSFFLSLLNSVAGSRVALKVNFEVIEHIQKTPLEYSNKINPVFVTQQVNNDSHVVTDFLWTF